MAAASDSEPQSTDRVEPVGFDALFDRHVDRIYTFAYRLTGSPELARGAAVATFKRAQVGFGAPRKAGETLVAQLYRAAYAEISVLRRRENLRALFGKKATLKVDPQAFIRADTHSQPLLDAFQRLGRADQDLLILRLGEDLSTAETAYVLRCPVVGVYARLRRALTGMLREFYGGYAVSPGSSHTRADLDRWGQRLDAGETGDETVDLAERLRLGRAWSTGIPAPARAEIRARVAAHAMLWPGLVDALGRRPAILWPVVGVVAIAGAVFLNRCAAQPAPVGEAPTATPQVAPSPTAAPVQGERLVFLYAPPDPVSRAYEKYPDAVSIYSANLDGSGLVRVWPSMKSRRSLSLESVSPDGRTLLYSVATFARLLKTGLPVEIKELHRIRLDGSGDIKIADRFVVGSIHWSPDGKWFAYLGEEDGWPVVHAVRPDGSDLRRLSEPREGSILILAVDGEQNVSWVGCPRVSDSSESGIHFPTGCAFRRTSPDGKELQPILPGQRPNFDISPPLFSPDGRQVAYRRVDCKDSLEFRAACHSLWVSNPDGTGAIEKPWENTPIFQWSPDGKRLQVAVTEGQEMMSRYLWSPDLGTVARLPEELQTPITPALGQWSPDGQKILYDHEAWQAPRFVDLVTGQVGEALSALKPSNFEWYFTWNALWMPAATP